MKQNNKNLLVILITTIFINTSCGDTKNNNSESADISATATITTNNNTTIVGDTAKENIVADIANVSVDLFETLSEERKKAIEERNANEERIWVYQIGDSYDDDVLAAKALDKLKESEPDLYVFKKSHNKYFIIKGSGVNTQKELMDSAAVIQKRTNNRISYLDLSIVCKKMPTNTKAIKYKIDGERMEAACKTCE